MPSCSRNDHKHSDFPNLSKDMPLYKTEMSSGVQLR